MNNVFFRERILGDQYSKKKPLTFFWFSRHFFVTPPITDLLPFLLKTISILAGHLEIIPKLTNTTNGQLASDLLDLPLISSWVGLNSPARSTLGCFLTRVNKSKKEI